MFETLAVQPDHLPDVLAGPEDVVVEEAVAVVGGLFRDLRAANGAVPDEGRDAVQRSRCRGEAGEGSAKATLPVDDILAPEAAQERVVLDREGDAVADLLPEPGVDGP